MPLVFVLFRVADTALVCITQEHLRIARSLSNRCAEQLVDIRDRDADQNLARCDETRSTVARQHLVQCKVLPGQHARRRRRVSVSSLHEERQRADNWA